MVNVLVYKESRFPADRLRIKKFVESYLFNKIKGNIEVGISIVGDRKMKMLNRTYRHLPEPTDVLSFPLEDGSASNKRDIEAGFSPDKSSPDKIFRLGDVIISYPQAVMEAADENKMVDAQIETLIAHGLNHLLGIHHE